MRGPLAAVRRPADRVGGRSRRGGARRAGSGLGRAAAADRRAALPRSRRRGELGRSALRARRVPARVRRHAGRADERGAALLGARPAAPARRAADGRGDVRPRRARAERGAQSRLGSLPLPLRGGGVGARGRGARLRGRGAPRRSGRAARPRGGGAWADRDRPLADRRHDRGRRAAAALVRLGRPGGADGAARPGDRGDSRRSAAARDRRLRRRAAGACSRRSPAMA